MAQNLFEYHSRLKVSQNQKIHIEREKKRERKNLRLKFIKHFHLNSPQFLQSHLMEGREVKREQSTQNLPSRSLDWGMIKSSQQSFGQSWGIRVDPSSSTLWFLGCRYRATQCLETDWVMLLVVVLLKARSLLAIGFSHSIIQSVSAFSHPNLEWLRWQIIRMD